MGFGLLVTVMVALFTANSPSLQMALLENPLLLIGAFVGEIALVIALSAGIRRFSVSTAGLLFIAYSALNGFTLSLVFLIYADSSIVAAFVTTAGLFGVMSVVGYTTQIDLSQFRSYLMMGLIGLIIAMVVNIFLHSGPLDMLISMAGVVIFTVLTAFDTQKIKRLASDPAIQADSNITLKMAILGALTLYLDFINLFLFLLRLMSGGRD